MTKEQELMDYLHHKVFDPVLNDKKASAKIKRGVNLTIGRMNRLNAEKMVQYFWSALSRENAVSFSEHLKSEGYMRFEDVAEEFGRLFDQKWLMK